jgi:1-aminocyclopropane-1-carboxylate deaminase
MMSEISTVAIGGRQVLVKREDLLHPFVSGNKFRKLKYNLLRALEMGASEILSFGGAFSNHIHALAYACHYYQIPLVLFIRGEDVQNNTLDFVRTKGAKLNFISRSEYREMKIRSSFEDYPNAYVVPEGGSNSLALIGIGEMMDEMEFKEGAQYCVSYGSGATSIGMMKKLNAHDHLHVFSSLKLPDFEKDFKQRCAELEVPFKSQITLHDNYHFGGFAKHNNVLIDFINAFPLPLDPIYTGKMMFGINDLIHQEKLDHRPIVAIHTGGLQGITGFNKRFGNLINAK